MCWFLTISSGHSVLVNIILFVLITQFVILGMGADPTNEKAHHGNSKGVFANHSVIIAFYIEHYSFGTIAQFVGRIESIHNVLGGLLIGIFDGG